MLFNVVKCKVMHLGKTNNKYAYYMNHQRLETVKDEKDLGVVFADNMKSSGQCLAAYKKASRMLRMIGRTIIYKNKLILLSLYKTLIRPHLEYCLSAWSPHYEKDKSLLERVQNRFTRMIPYLREIPYEEGLKKLRL